MRWYEPYTKSNNAKAHRKLVKNENSSLENLKRIQYIYASPKVI